MNTEQHEKIKKTLKALGGVLAVLGAILAVVGFANFFAAAGSGEMPTLFFCCFLGLPMFAAGLSMLLWGFRREIAQYTNNEVTPVAGEAISDLTPAVSDMVRATRESGEPCPHCGEKNPAGANFCNACGAPLSHRCAACGAENEPGAKFCGNCGKPL